MSKKITPETRINVFLQLDPNNTPFFKPDMSVDEFMDIIRKNFQTLPANGLVGFDIAEFLSRPEDAIPEAEIIEEELNTTENPPESINPEANKEEIVIESSENVKQSIEETVE